jgi:lipoprotein-anchoring transpeptidase ErfK/SrfK
MFDLSRRHVLMGLGAAALMPLSACAPMEAAAPAEPPVIEPLSYASRADGAFTVPGVPYDQIPAWLHRQVVTFETDKPAGSIVIVSNNGLLHYVLGDGFALRYGIAVGREGLGWRGLAEVYRKAEWPSWRPTPEMIERDPDSYLQYAEGQPGGPRNPLGARAIYLRTVATRADEGIRIHGTPQWRSIGRRASNGCFRMINHDVIDLYARVQNGAQVTVL